MQSIFMLSVSYAKCHTQVFLQSVIMLNVICAEYNIQALYAEGHFAECCYAECRGAIDTTAK